MADETPKYNPSTGTGAPNCRNCHHEIVEHLKAEDEICVTCLKEGTKETPFPKHKTVVKAK
jgi:hypothetical protein